MLYACFEYVKNFSILPEGQLIVQSTAETSNMITSGDGQFLSEIQTCRFFFRVDFDFAVLIFPSSLNIDGGYAASS